jgi:hypothetical protein
VFTDEIALVPDGEDFPAMLRAQILDTRSLLAGFGEEHGGLRYAPDKWSVRETIGHLADCERVLAYRALRFIRGDQTPLAGFDHNAYVPAGRFDDRTLASMIEEFESVRAATVTLVAGAPEGAWTIRGPVGRGTITTAALLYIIAGHERHHQQVLRERYLPLVQPGMLNDPIRVE